MGNTKRDEGLGAVFLFELWKRCKTDRDSQLHHTLVPHAGSAVVGVARYFQPTQRRLSPLAYVPRQQGWVVLKSEEKEVVVVGGNEIYVFM